jgi:hypothetical protein
MITSAMDSGATDGFRSMSFAITCAARSSALTGEREPVKLPMGVRIPSTMKASVIRLENLRHEEEREGFGRREMDVAEGPSESEADFICRLHSFRCRI